MAEMTEREALEVLELRIGCETVPDDECQNRSCWGCDYHVTGDAMIEAMKVAAGVLRERVSG